MALTPLRLCYRVASRADAWIETQMEMGTTAMDMLGSRPARTRGLKLIHYTPSTMCHVASRADAWIETCHVPLHW